MITEPTVFILGAGASAPYGFPTGSQLKDLVEEFNVDILIKHANSTSLLSNDWRQLLIGHQGILRDFFEDLKKSGSNSVDAFLENKPRYEALGKELISYQLISCENEDNLYIKEGNWYKYLYSNFLKENFEDIPKNKVSFITFNYDRSLETFLFNAIKSDFDKTHDEVVEVVNSIPIIHLHGTLGNLPFKEIINTREFESRITKKQIEICANNIKIVHEIKTMDKEFEEANKLISNAKNVWFLGFGYGKVNLRRLNIPKNLIYVTNVFGTTMGLKRGEITQKNELLNNRISYDYLDRNGDLDCLNYLRVFAEMIK